MLLRRRLAPLVLFAPALSLRFRPAGHPAALVAASAPFRRASVRHMASAASEVDSVSAPELSDACADVFLIPFWSDNYAYYIRDRSSGVAALVDPADPEQVLSYLAEQDLPAPQAILCTHKHQDHSGGNVALRKHYAQAGAELEVVGSGYEATPGLTHTMQDGDTYALGGLQVQAIHTPCHTRGHICFFVTDPAQPDLAPVLFSGDNLFVGGCGRFFEGSAEDMYTSLGWPDGTLAKLPPSTQVFCGHEYTASNLRFALSVDGDNPYLLKKVEWVTAQRDQKLPTIPTTIGGERLWNPFMRTDLPELAAAAGMASASPVEVMKAVRRMKDSF
eukprot:scaffold991_cov227-Pinguiococcus_pyrenoidosus.AAC.10